MLTDWLSDKTATIGLSSPRSAIPWCFDAFGKQLQEIITHLPASLVLLIWLLNGIERSIQRTQLENGGILRGR
jgi:hypothetical protein